MNSFHNSNFIGTGTLNPIYMTSYLCRGNSLSNHDTGSRYILNASVPTYQHGGNYNGANEDRRTNSSKYIGGFGNNRTRSLDLLSGTNRSRGNKYVENRS